ncbi:hypothetical protein C4K38_6340 [Pseudomonas chlororaphis subsp. piscium]|nr:hypothetical protein C4K38_6340 [Pseudomonas chlororaphis subsp. piscium]
MKVSFSVIGMKQEIEASNPMLVMESVSDQFLDRGLLFV